MITSKLTLALLLTQQLSFWRHKALCGFEFFVCLMGFSLDRVCCRSTVWEGLMLATSRRLIRPRSRLELVSRGPRETLSEIVQHVDRAPVLCPAHHWQGPFSAAVAARHPCSLSMRDPFSILTDSPQARFGNQPSKGARLLKD